MTFHKGLSYLRLLPLSSFINRASLSDSKGCGLEQACPQWMSWGSWMIFPCFDGDLTEQHHRGPFIWVYRKYTKTNGSCQHSNHCLLWGITHPESTDWEHRLHFNPQYCSERAHLVTTTRYMFRWTLPQFYSHLRKGLNDVQLETLAQVCLSVCGRLRPENHKFKTYLGYRVSSRLT